MGAEQIKFIFKFETSVEAAALGLQIVLKQNGVPDEDFKLYGNRLSLGSLLPALRKMEHKGFDVAGQNFRFTCGTVAKGHLDFLLVQSLSSELTISWDDWALQFIRSENFVMAWITDVDYDYWQNAEDPLQYTAVGKPYSHLPMKSNGLPYPLEQKIINISRNPGRWIFRDDYVEAVGAVMWLGELFWTLTGRDKAMVMRQNWIRISNPCPLVMKVQAADSSFTTAEGISGELQERLRVLLFGDRIA